jgi:hypothetical protein
VAAVVEVERLGQLDDEVNGLAGLGEEVDLGLLQDRS